MDQLFSANQMQRFEASDSPAHAAIADRMANWLFAMISRRDLVAVAGFCAVGLILTLAAMAWLPDFAAAMAQIGAVP
jgi:hypothetical protein